MHDSKHLTDTHTCGGTIRIGEPGTAAVHYYCDKCQAYTTDIYGEMPTGEDIIANCKAWENKEPKSPSQGG